ncbi:DUF742 domain-containing protein [Nocardia sp. NPDC059239]|uniref:DUF742 domain-containing protein n=1 Tax=unclassified Nocardia TaxID=2637762 RepID=UPI0036B18001
MTYDDHGHWLDDDPGPLVRPFAVTRGRAGRNLHELDMITLVVAVHSATDTASLDREYEEILRMCQGRPVSIAEISAQLNLLLAAVKVLVSDLIGAGYLIYRSPTRSFGNPDLGLLQAVLDGIRNA